MEGLLAQFSYPVFMYMLALFFLVISAFGVVVGLGLALRSSTMLRGFEIMNRWVSVRQLMRPLSVPHFIEPTLMKRPAILGTVITPCAVMSVVLLNDIPVDSFQSVLLGQMSYPSAEVVSQYLRWFLLIGNGLCVFIGLSLLFFPRFLSKVEGYTDMWFSVRKRTRIFHQMHMGVDQWVLAHPTVSGITLIILSVGLGFTMYMRI